MLHRLGGPAAASALKHSLAALDGPAIARAAPGVLLVAILTFLILFAPDIAYVAMDKPLYPFASTHFWPVTLLLAFFLTVARARWLRLATIALLILGQLVWFGAYEFFGRVLKPEQLQLSVHQMDEVWIGVITGLGILAPALMIVGAAGLALLVVQEGLGPRLVRRSHVGSVLLALLLVGYNARLALHSDLFILYPSATTPSSLGPMHAGVLALRQSWLRQSLPADPKKVAYRLTPVDLGREPVTVIVVMGESINPMRLGLFGFDRDTTPRLDAFAADPPAGFALRRKVGFAAGVATIASVPNFIKIPYYPVGLGASPVSLFRIASDNGFRSYYYSAQLAHSLEIAGEAHRIDRVETVDRWPHRYATSRDDMITDFLAETPAGPRRFIFLHQRVNHAPYYDNCDQAPEINALKPDSPSKEDKRRNDYDNGLRCYDRSMSRILDFARAQPGEVHVFATSDHNELMGENGMWGHGPTEFAMALVPIIHFTNRPDGVVAKIFADMRLPTAFDLTALVARSLGAALTVEGYDPDVFYVNAPLPFGLSGFLKITRQSDGGFRSEHFNKSGQMIRAGSERLPERAYDFAR